MNQLNGHGICKALIGTWTFNYYIILRSLISKIFDSFHTDSLFFNNKYIKNQKKKQFS